MPPNGFAASDHDHVPLDPYTALARINFVAGDGVPTYIYVQPLFGANGTVIVNELLVIL